MNIFNFFIGFIYLSGMIVCFTQLILRLKLKYPNLEYDFYLKMEVIILSCFSWIGLFFVITNDELNS